MQEILQTVCLHIIGQSVCNCQGDGEMKKLAKLLLMLVTGISLLGAVPVTADENNAVMNAYTEDDSVVLYLRDVSVDKVFIGNQECTDFEVSEAGPTRTIVILDNSISINAKYRDGIKQALEDLVAARNDGDLFTIALLDEELNYIVQDSNDYFDIKSKIDAIEFYQHDNYLFKSIYEVLGAEEQSGNTQFTRIIAISDGAESELLGYTQEELDNKIKDLHIPIYTIGCITKDNSENLKRMFAVARLSNGKEYLMDDTPLDTICSQINDDSKVIKLTVKPQKEFCDGTKKSIRIEYSGSNTTIEQKMPFIAEAAGESEGESTPEEPAPAEKKGGIPIYVPIIGAVVLAAAGIGVFLSKKKKKKAEAEPKSEFFDVSTIGVEKTQVMVDPDKQGTLVLDYAKKQNNATLILKDVDDASKTFSFPIRGSVRIGKNPKTCQIHINYSSFISSEHCEIIRRDDGYVVKDGTDKHASTNGTFLNGTRVTSEVPIKNDDTLRLGDRSFKVTFK